MTVFVNNIKRKCPKPKELRELLPTKVNTFLLYKVISQVACR